MKGQLSAEMLILMVVILAVVAVAATQLLSSAKETGASIGEQTRKLNDIATQEMKSQEGGFCFEDEDCQDSLRCERNRCG